MAVRPGHTLGLDFGTSNSAIASVGRDGRARLVPLEGEASGLPSAIFFNAEDRSLHIGREAMNLYLGGTEGRLMRSLKSLLGSSLLDEKTAVPEGVVSFQDVIGRFLGELALRAERHLGAAPRHVVIGRPVHFVDGDSTRDERAESALLKAAAAAGFSKASFELEPIAAAFDHEQRLSAESLVLIVDIGGGTSDFTVVRLGPQRAARRDRKEDILATSGVHIGGTDFDRKLSLDEVMPLLGLRHLGPHGREVPGPMFLDLATWHLINWQYTPKVWQQAQALRTNYSDARMHERLLTVLRERLGHRVASEVEQAKIRSSAVGTATSIDLSAIEPGLATPLDARAMERDLAALLDEVVSCAHECVRRAGMKPGDLDALYLTGGSSALWPFQQALRRGFPGTELIEGDLFGGVASGLAYAAERA